VKRHVLLHVRKLIAERNPALLASTDFEDEDYLVFRDALILTETSEVIRAIIKGQEFWLSKSHIRIE
jgi:hypothetical protein